MDRTYWHKQTAEQPLFPDLLWSRPENKQHAGKLLIIGGNIHGFRAPAEAYTESLKAGVGSTRVFLPDALHKTVSKVFPEIEFAPSTPSGSFAQKSLADLLDVTNWTDGLLFAGDFGKNSETAILLESLVDKYRGQLTLVGDSIDYFKHQPKSLLDRTGTTLVLTFQQLQQLAPAANFDQAITSTLDLLHLVDILHNFTKHFEANIIIEHSENIIVAVNGQVSTKKVNQADSGKINIATHAAIWWLQNPSKAFEALSSSLLSG